MDKISEAQDIIARIRPELVENRIVYEAILSFYSDNALVETQIADLKELLKCKAIEVHKASAESFKECVYNLLDSCPELTASKGMLRYYEAVPDFDWQECEKAEIAFGDAFTMDSYGWKPDFWTVFKTEEAGSLPKLTLIVANA